MLTSCSNFMSSDCNHHDNHHHHVHHYHDHRDDLTSDAGIHLRLPLVHHARRLPLLTSFSPPGAIVEDRHIQSDRKTFSQTKRPSVRQKKTFSQTKRYSVRQKDLQPDKKDIQSDKKTLCQTKRPSARQKKTFSQTKRHSVRQKDIKMSMITQGYWDTHKLSHHRRKKGTDRDKDTQTKIRAQPQTRRGKDPERQHLPPTGEAVKTSPPPLTHTLTHIR